MPHDVFISYASDDKSIADAACATLENRGVRCWIAPRDILPGKNWGECIIDAIQESRVFILVFSSHANASQQVMREVERAVNKGLIVVPVRVEDAEPSKAMEYFISAPHWLDAMSPPLQRHLDELATKVGVILGEPEPVAARKPKPPRPTIPRSTRLVLAGVLGLILVVLVTWGLTSLFSNGDVHAEGQEEPADTILASGDIWSGTASLPRSRARGQVVMKIARYDPDGTFVGGLFFLSRSHRPAPLTGTLTGTSLTFKSKNKTYTGEIVDGQIQARWQEGRRSGDMRLSPNRGSAKAMTAGSAWVGTLHDPRSGKQEEIFLRINQRTDEGEVNGLACLPFRNGRSDVVSGLVLADRVFFRVSNRRFAGVLNRNVLEGEAGVRRDGKFRLELRSQPERTFAVDEAWAGTATLDRGRQEHVRLLVTSVDGNGGVGLEVSSANRRPGTWKASGCLFADTLVFHGGQNMSGVVVRKKDELNARLRLGREEVELTLLPQR